MEVGVMVKLTALQFGIHSSRHWGLAPDHDSAKTLPPAAEVPYSTFIQYGLTASANLDRIGPQANGVPAAHHILKPVQIILGRTITNGNIFHLIQQKQSFSIWLCISPKHHRGTKATFGFCSIFQFCPNIKVFKKSTTALQKAVQVLCRNLYTATDCVTSRSCAKEFSLHLIC